MEIVNLINSTYQLIDHNGTVITQGSYEHCFAFLSELRYREEERMYEF
jgi:hypothetical protein